MKRHSSVAAPGCGRTVTGTFGNKQGSLQVQIAQWASTRIPDCIDLKPRACAPR
jgi:hypothetical protein